MTRSLACPYRTCPVPNRLLELLEVSGLLLALGVVKVLDQVRDLVKRKEGGRESSTLDWIDRHIVRATTKGENMTRVQTFCFIWVFVL
jgi:hypothetical protein